MGKIVDYYFSPASPWSYLGHERFARLAAAAGATIEPKPVDYTVIFPQTGGLPLGKRAPARLAYRLTELERWKAVLGVALNVQPRHFPVDASPACCLIWGAAAGTRMALAGALMAVTWCEERDLADPAVLREVGARHGVADLDAAVAAGRPLYEAATREALDCGVFGAPTYAYRGELFWGQDRLEFLQRALSAG